MEEYSYMPKPLLFRRLREQYNLERLERAYKRGQKRRNVDGVEDVHQHDALNASRSRRRTVSSISTPLRHDTLASPCHGHRLSSRFFASSPSSESRGTRDGYSGKDKITKATLMRSKKRAGCPPLPRPPSRSLPLIDPIMLTEIPDGAPTFVYKRPNGKDVTFNLGTLIDYFLSTGDFTEPETRLDFSDADLERIDMIATKANLGKESVLSARKDKTRFAELNFRRDALNGLERCAGELVTEMVACIEGDGDDESDLETGQMRLVMYIFPLFCDLFRQLHEADAAFASACMKHFATYVEGPPNRRTVDRFGILEIVRTFLQQVAENPAVEYGSF